MADPNLYPNRKEILWVPECPYERGRSLGMTKAQVDAMLKDGSVCPAFDEPQRTNNFKTNPNYNLSKPKADGAYYLKWHENGIKRSKVLSHDLEESRRMRDAFFKSINHYTYRVLHKPKKK